MKILRNWGIVFILEFILIICVYLMAPEKKAPSELNFFFTHGARTVSVEEYGKDSIKIIASGDNQQVVEFYQLGKLDGLQTTIYWINEKHAVVSILDDQGTLKSKYQVEYSDTENAIIYQGDKKEEVKEEEPKDQPEEKEPVLPSDVTTPEVVSINNITQDSDINHSIASTPAKPQSPDTNEEQVYHAPDNKQYDLKIESGLVSVTLDQGVTWRKVPISGSRLQDFWLSYYRMGNQSYFIDDSMIMIAFAQKYEQPHIIVSLDQGATWQDVEINSGSRNINQISIVRNEAGGYRITMMADSSVMLNGSSSDGLNWTFQEPVAFNEDISGMYSMALMQDGTIMITTFDDVAISKDDGKTYTHLKEKAPAIAKTIDFYQMPYEEDGSYCIPLQNGKVAKSKDGDVWK